MATLGGKLGLRTNGRYPRVLDNWAKGIGYTRRSRLIHGEGLDVLLGDYMETESQVSKTSFYKDDHFILEVSY